MVVGTDNCNGSGGGGGFIVVDVISWSWFGDHGNHVLCLLKSDLLFSFVILDDLNWLLPIRLSSTD